MELREKQVRTWLKFLNITLKNYRRRVVSYQLKFVLPHPRYLWRIHQNPRIDCSHKRSVLHRLEPDRPIHWKKQTGSSIVESRRNLLLLATWWRIRKPEDQRRLPLIGGRSLAIKSTRSLRQIIDLGVRRIRKVGREGQRFRTGWPMDVVWTWK